MYSTEVPAWGKEVKYQLVHDAGYPFYSSPLSVRSGDLEKYSPCLKKLVPVLQQAEVDYFADPAATNELVLDLVTQFNNGWVYSAGAADYSVETMLGQGIVSNGENDFVGDIDAERVQSIIDITTPIYTAANNAPKAGLKPEDLFTNEFLDETIGLS